MMFVVHEGCRDDVVDVAGLVDEGQFVVVVILKGFDQARFGCNHMVGFEVV